LYRTREQKSLSCRGSEIPARLLEIAEWLAENCRQLSANEKRDFSDNEHVELDPSRTPNAKENNIGHCHVCETSTSLLLYFPP
jgi:hypothetical protein